MRRATCSQAQASLADLIDEVNRDHAIVLIRRRGFADVAMLPVADLSGLLETIHLLRSLKNARRLLSALECALGSDTFSKDLAIPNDLEEGDL